MAAKDGSEHPTVWSGSDPSDYNPAHPLTLFIIQVVIIMGTTRLLNVALSRLRQPRVISEIIGGIILGPSVMGRIPGFNEALFPKESLSYLNLVANFGLVLYLFLVGVEVDPKVVTKNARKSLSISAAGITLPFATGIAVSYGLYNINTNKDQVSFASFMLFMGAAMSITAFPVLARIVTELNLLQSFVGNTVLCAAVCDDVAAWVLLALVMSILNSTDSLVALYTILAATGWSLVLFTVGRRLLHEVIKRTGASVVNGPTVTTMSVTLVLVMASAFVTDIIGLHAIFGGFLVGLLIPHEGGFASALTEKIEDLISILFLPIYFALSGLKTQIGAIDSLAAWGYLVLVIFVAMAGKVVGCSLVARCWKFEWREALTIGVFMSCKGLVELIALNIGLDAGAIDERIFAIMVIMAIVTTCATTPLVKVLYPLWYQKAAEAKHMDSESLPPTSSEGERAKVNVMVVLNKIEYVPPMMTIIQLLQPQAVRRNSVSAGMEEKQVSRPAVSPMNVYALRLVPFGQRMSAVMKFGDANETILHDPIMNVFRTFGQLNLVNVKASLAIVPPEEFAKQVSESAENSKAELVVVPWSGTGSIIEDVAHPDANDVFEPQYHESTNPMVASFVQGVFNDVHAKVGVFVDRGLGVVSGITPSTVRAQGVGIKVYMPFFGGIDDRAALNVVVRLLENPRVSATVVRIHKSDDKSVAPTAGSISSTPSSVTLSDLPNQQKNRRKPGEPAHPARPPLVHHMSTSSADLYSTQDRLESASADEILLTKYFNPQNGALRLNARVTYKEVGSPTPVLTAIKDAKDVLGRKDLVVVGRSHADARVSSRNEWYEMLKEMSSSNVLASETRESRETRKTLGHMAEAMLVNGVMASIFVVQGVGNRATQ